jgi:hypothetical protein
MSGYTMTQGELLYSVDAAGTVTAIQTAEQPFTVGYPPVVIPGGFFANSSEAYRQSSLRLQCGGLLIATATVPTFSIRAVAATSDAFAATSAFVTSGTFTPVATTGVWFEMNLHIAVRTLPIQTISGVTLATVSAHGWFDVLYLSSPVRYSLPAPAATYTPAGTIDTSVQQYLYPTLALGAATAGNTLTIEYLKLYGEN